jgi:2-succinyl-5-enolpyruvyl-6-hydroxy-3-cyclohexene-1-carboxylate synthase
MYSDLFIGSSRSIREVEAVVNYRPGIKTFANRGLAGIDGNIATTFGIAKYSNRTFAILGDLTFLHDLSSLLIQPANPTTILVIDNNGGAIFNTLEQAGTPNFERVFATPHNRDLAPLVRGFGIPVDTVDNPKDLATAISIITGNCEIILVKVPNRDEMVNYLSNRKVQLASALRIGANLA